MAWDITPSVPRKSIFAEAMQYLLIKLMFTVPVKHGVMPAAGCSLHSWLGVSLPAQGA